MECAFCGIHPDPVILIPIKQKDEALCCFSCYNCAVSHGVYCTKHNVAHTGFLGDDTTACLYCVEEEVQAKKGIARSLYTNIFGSLSEEELESIQDAAQMSSFITGDEDPVSVLRFIITKAHRLKVPLENVVVEIIDKRSVSMILPDSIF